MKGYIFFIFILINIIIGIYKNDEAQAVLSLLLLPMAIYYIILSKEFGDD